MRTKLLAVFLALMVATPAMAGNAAAVETQEQRINMNSEYAHNPGIDVGKVIVAEHDVDEMGGLDWVNDSGGVESFEAELNTSSNNSYSYVPTEVEDDTLSDFPRKGTTNVSVLNVSEWTVSGTNSTSYSITDTSGNTATGVESLTFGTDGSFGANSNASATFTLPEAITDSPDKLYLQQVFDVGNLEAGAEVTFEYRDSGGDARQVVINSSKDASKAAVAANQTGEGFVAQPQSGTLDVVSNDDGSFDDVASVRVIIAGGDANVTVTGLNAESSSQWALGTQRSNGEVSTIYEKSDPGRLMLTDINSVGSWADDAIIHNKGVHNLQFTAEQTGVEDRNVTYSKAEQYGGYEWKQTAHFRLSLPTGYDVTYYDVSFTDTQRMISERYALVEIAEAVGDTDFSNITSYTSKTTLYGNAQEGTTHTLDDTVQVGKTYVFHSVILITSGEKDSLTKPQVQQAGGGFWGSGNPVMTFFTWVGSGFASLAAIFGLRRKFGGS